MSRVAPAGPPSYGPKVSRAALFSIGLASVATACESPQLDPLDPGVIGDVANDPGDAVGSSYSGSYNFEATSLDCDCPLLEAEDFPGGGEPLGLEPGQQVDPCVEIDTFYGRSVSAGGTIELTQSDGIEVWENWLPVMTGPVYADGDFVVAGYEDFSETFLNAQVVSRIDGRHLDASRFTGILRQRVIAELPGLSLDCRASHQVDAMRIDDVAQ